MRMRWVSGTLLVATIGLLGWLGLAPTSVGLTNGVADVPCRAVLAPIVNGTFVDDSEQLRERVEEWLLETGRGDDRDVIAGDDLDAALGLVHGLCADARTGRLGAMSLVGFAGLGLAGVAATWSRPRRTIGEAA